MQRAQRARTLNVHGIALDISAWPLVQVTPPPYSLSDEAVMEFVDFHRKLVRSQPTPHVLILDLRDCDRLNNHQRTRLSKVLSSADDDGAASSCAGTALVFSSPMLRGILTATFWVFRPLYPVKVWPDVASAQRWAYTLLAGSAQLSNATDRAA